MVDLEVEYVAEGEDDGCVHAVCLDAVKGSLDLAWI